jgi:hypothetical protein
MARQAGPAIDTTPVTATRTVTNANVTTSNGSTPKSIASSTRLKPADTASPMITPITNTRAALSTGHPKARWNILLEWEGDGLYILSGLAFIHLMVHRATWPHRGVTPRIIAQPPVTHHQPLALRDGSDMCAVERAILRCLE